MTNNNTQYSLIGGIVIAAITAIILIVIWLSSGSGFESYSTYLVYMQESVTGINIDSSVEFNGVEVGTVKEIKIDHQNPKLVKLLLSVKNNTPISRGTVAMLASRGITGISYIALKDRSSDLRPIIVEPGQKYPIIRTAPSIFLRLDAALNLLTNNFRQINESIQALLNKDNLQSIQNSLANLDKITTNLAHNTRQINIIIENTSEASKRFNPLLQSGIGTLKVLETQTLPEVYRLLLNMDDMSRTLAELSLEIKQNPSILVRGVNRTYLGPGEKK